MFMLRHGLAAATVLAYCGGCCAPGSEGAKSAKPAVPPADFYVAANGNDAWSGKLPAPTPDGADGPFATLERARDAVRTIGRGPGNAGGPIRVVVRNGAYRLKRTLEFDARDSGTPGAPVVYRACPGEEVRVTGAVRLPPAAFRPVTDPAVRVRLAPEVRDRVLQVDLRALGITELGTFPVRFRGMPDVPELFINDRRMPLARWPDKGWTTIAKIVDSGSVPRGGDTNRRGGVFEYSGDRPRRWTAGTGVWLRGYWCFDWFSEALRVKMIDPEAHRIDLAAPTVYGVRQGNPSPRRWYAFNLLEELDAPGEYFIDRKARRLYFLPPAEVSNARIELSMLRGPALRTQDTSHLVLRGFIIESTRNAGIEIHGGTDVRLQACEVRNTRGVGINVSGGTRHRIEACDIHDTGTGGIILAGGDRRSLTPAGHEAVNNHIWRYSCHQLTYANALLIRGVGNRAAHNLIHDAPHQAIGIDGNDHVFEFNIVHHVCMETDDCGAYYKGRNPSCRGNIVRYNFWYDIGSPMGHGNAAVYFDDGDGGDTVFGNIFLRCGEPGGGSFGTVFSHGGHDLTADNNIFIQCKRALGSSPWNFKRWKAMIDGALWQKRLLREVDITRPPYTTRYPGLVGFMDPKPDQTRVSRARRNVFVMCAEVKSGNWQVGPQQNWVTDRDPGFVDMARGDFSLRPGSEVFRRLPGFKPIPFHKIGLVADELRPNPPKLAWTETPPRPLPPLPRKALKPVYNPPPKNTPPPLFRVRPAAGDIVVDGRLAPGEWPLDDPAAVMTLRQDVSGRSATPTSRAWLAWTAEGLYVAVDNTVATQARLEGDRWGKDDAVEIALRPPGTKSIFVFRGFGNGTARYGVTDTPAKEPKSWAAEGLQYAARRPTADHWSAEFFIPFRLMGLNAGKRLQRSAFSLTVRKAADDLWLMWEGTRAHSYDVDRAGFIEFVP